MNTETVTAVILGLVINEFCDVSPWLARKVIRVAARCVPDLTARERLEEEWVAGLQDRPGKVLKLVTALTILVSSMTTVRSLFLAGRPRFPRLRSLIAHLFDHEGRLTMATTVGAGLIDFLNPMGHAGGWSLLITMLVLSVTVNGIDLWLQIRRQRRQQRVGQSDVR